MPDVPSFLQSFIAATPSVCLSETQSLVEGLPCNLPDVLLHYTMVCGLNSGEHMRKLCLAAICTVVS